MIVIVAVAIYGAVLGLSLRPAMRAVVISAASVAALQLGSIWLSVEISHRPGMAGVALAIQSVAGADAKDLVPTLSAAAFAAAFTAFISALTQSGEQRRRVRRVSAIDD